MLSYFIRRILLALPTLFITSAVIFGLSKCAPHDPVLDLGDATFRDFRDQERAVYTRAKNAGLDKPAFYFALTTAAFPDTAYRIFPHGRRDRLLDLCAQAGHWPLVDRYEQALRKIRLFTDKIPDSLTQAASIRLAVADLIACDRLDVLGEKSDTVCALLRTLPANPLPDVLQVAVSQLIAGADPGRMYRPAFYWYGIDNQYHKWLTGFLTGDLGLSRLTNKPIWDSLLFAMASTMIVNSLALLIAYLLAVPMGVAMARRRARSADKITRGLLLFLYAMPIFWVGSLLILFFATPDFGLYLIGGISLEFWQGSGLSYGEWCLHNFDKFILPIMTLSLHALALLALQMRGGVLEVIGQDFIRTARAKGVGEQAIYWRHAFCNALFPIISVFASLFPTIFAGSLVVEFLFQFPGMGMKTQEAFMKGDYPVLFAIMMFAATLTIIGNLIADVMYGLADPRVRFTK